VLLLELVGHVKVDEPEPRMARVNGSYHPPGAKAAAKAVATVGAKVALRKTTLRTALALRDVNSPIARRQLTGPPPLQSSIINGVRP